MPNKLEQIALKKQREAEEAREAEIKSLASVIASETISRIKNLSADEKKPLEATISELSKGLAEAVALSNEKLGGEVSVSFAKLVENFKSALPEKFDNSTNEKLFAKIADDILKFDNAIKSLELNPTINLKGITATELKAEVDRLIEKLPKDAKDSVKIEYEKAGATNYINVRLTDGINFYKALGGGGAGAGFDKEGLATEAKQDEIVSAIENSGSVATPDTIRNGKKTVSTPGTAVAIVSTNTPVVAVVVQALAGNTGLVYIGDSSVDSTNGMELQAGQATGIAIDDLSKVYVDADDADDGVSFIGS